MAKDLWLPNGYILPDGSEVRTLLYSGEEWQIFDTDGLNHFLISRPELTRRWIEGSFLADSLFKDIAFGPEALRGLSSKKKYTLAPIENGGSPEGKVDALAFALALRESRKLTDDVSFHDAIYVEQYSRLLPAWTLTPQVDDEVVLGIWITGGVRISTQSFRRLNSLTGWMPAGDLAEIIEAAGFSVPADVGLLTRRRPSMPMTDEPKLLAGEETAKPDQAESKTKAAREKRFTLPGRPQLEEFFNEHVIDIILNSEKYRALGIEFPSAIVLHGPPGCGKTFAVERLVEYIDWPSYSIDSNSIGSPYIHATSKKISEVFDKAIDGAPSVVVIDEMESFLSDRQSISSSGQHHVEEVAEFLRRIPEAIKNNVLIIAMTNLIERIDPAILRRGRFDHVIEVEMPSRVEVAALLDSLLCKLPTADELDVEMLLDELTGKALSDTAFVIREAARFAAKAGKSRLEQAEVEAALRSLPKKRAKGGRRIGFIREV